MYLLRVMFCFYCPLEKFSNLVFPNVVNKSLIRCENWKWPETLVLIVHGYQTPQFENFVIPLTWLSYPTTSKHSYPCYGFLTSQFQNLTNPSHRILLDWGSHFCIFSEISRNYMSIKIYIVNNITVLVWHNIFSLGFFACEPWCQ